MTGLKTTTLVTATAAQWSILYVAHSSYEHTPKTHDCWSVIIIDYKKLMIGNNGNRRDVILKDKIKQLPVVEILVYYSFSGAALIKLHE